MKNERGRGSDTPKINTTNIIKKVKRRKGVKAMNFENMNLVRAPFVGACHCPYCKTGLIVIDNKPVSCPVCELRKLKESYQLERRKLISQMNI
jgi:uncharacterized Zn finger protein (UPF0148 family)